MSPHVLRVATQHGETTFALSFGQKELFKHALVVGQSGSGKSFMLARLVEELVLHSEARLVILDLNGDFSMLGKVARENDWNGDGRTPAPGYAYEERETFAAEWKARVGDLKAFVPGGGLQISVGRLSRSGFRELLDLDRAAHPEALWLADRIFEMAAPRNLRERTWSGPAWLKLKDEIVRWAQGLTPERSGKGADPYRSLPSYLAATGAVAAAQRISYGLADALDCQIWNEHEEASGFDRHWKRSDRLPRVTVVDVGSIQHSIGRLVATRYVLERVWELSDKERKDARDAKTSGKGTRSPTRRPIFIVIDEAHNLAPPDPKSAAARGVLHEIRKTAAEGRKNGLFLLLATQRPRKLHADVASECDNVVGMKLTGTSDIRWMQERFSSESKQYWKQLKLLKKGEALFAGAWAPKEEPAERRAFQGVVKGAPRRSQEGGGDLCKQAIRRYKDLGVEFQMGWHRGLVCLRVTAVDETDDADNHRPRVDDWLTSVDGVRATADNAKIAVQHLIMVASRKRSGHVPIKVERDGKEIDLDFSVFEDFAVEFTSAQDGGVVCQRVTKVDPRALSDGGALEVDDFLLAVNGRSAVGDHAKTAERDLMVAVRDRDGKVPITVKRKGETVELDFTVSNADGRKPANRG